MLTTILVAAMAQAYGNTPSPSRVIAAPNATAAPVAPTAPATPVAGRALRDLPGTTISYYEVAGRTVPEIELALKTMLADNAVKDKVPLYSWKVGTELTKATSGTKCVVKKASSNFTAKVSLPRLAKPTKVKKGVMAQWTAYVTNAENSAATSLWFLAHRLRGAEQALVGLACDQADPAWNATLERVKAELSALNAKRAPAALPKPAA